MVNSWKSSPLDKVKAVGLGPDNAIEISLVKPRIGRKAEVSRALDSPIQEISSSVLEEKIIGYDSKPGSHKIE